MSLADLHRAAALGLVVTSLGCGHRRQAAPQSINGELRLEVSRVVNLCTQWSRHDFSAQIQDVATGRLVFFGSGITSMVVSLPQAPYRVELGEPVDASWSGSPECVREVVVAPGERVTLKYEYASGTDQRCEVADRSRVRARTGSSGWAILGVVPGEQEVMRIPSALVEWEGVRPGMLFAEPHSAAGSLEDNPYMQACGPHSGSWGWPGGGRFVAPVNERTTAASLATRLALCWGGTGFGSEGEPPQPWMLGAPIVGEWTAHGEMPHHRSHRAVLRVAADAAIEVRPGTATSFATNTLFRGEARGGVRLATEPGILAVARLDDPSRRCVAETLPGFVTNLEFPSCEHHFEKMVEPPRRLGGSWATLDLGRGPEVMRVPWALQGFDDAPILKTYREFMLRGLGSAFAGARDDPWMFSCEGVTEPWRGRPGAQDADPMVASFLDWRDLTCLLDPPPAIDSFTGAPWPAATHPRE